MAWQTPKTNWQAADVVSKDDFNRIEGNVQELQNTKETPAGAQAKADAAESAAKSYADGVAAGEAGAVQAELAAHKADNASTTTKGHVQLNNTITSTSTTLAATANIVKVVNDAKVNKPASAVSGNVAIFDGGPGKIKDSGVALVAATYGTVTYDEQILGRATVTKEVEVGSGKTKGVIVVRDSRYDDYQTGGMFIVSTTQQTAKGIRLKGDNHPVISARETSTYLCDTGTRVQLRDAYIAGTKLKLIFYCDDDSYKTLKSEVYWEAW